MRAASGSGFCKEVSMSDTRPLLAACEAGIDWRLKLSMLWKWGSIPFAANLKFMCVEMLKGESFGVLPKELRVSILLDFLCAKVGFWNIF